VPGPWLVNCHVYRTTSRVFCSGEIVSRPAEALGEKLDLARIRLTLQHEHRPPYIAQTVRELLEPDVFEERPVRAAVLLGRNASTPREADIRRRARRTELLAYLVEGLW